MNSDIDSSGMGLCISLFMMVAVFIAALREHRRDQRQKRKRPPVNPQRRP